MSLQVSDKRLGNTHQHTRHKEGAEDLLVITGDGQRQVNVEVVTPVIRVSRSNVRQRTPIPVGDEHRHFDQDDPGHQREETVLPSPGRYWNRDDDGNQQRPHHGVEKANGA